MATSRLSSRVDERKSVAIVQPFEAARLRPGDAPGHNNPLAAHAAHLSCWQHGGRGNCQFCGVGVKHGALLLTATLKVFLCRDCAAKFRARLFGGGDAQHRNGHELGSLPAGNRNLTAI